MLKSLKMVYAKFQFQIVFDGKTNDSEIKLYCINLYNILSLPCHSLGAGRLGCEVPWTQRDLWQTGIIPTALEAKGAKRSRKRVKKLCDTLASKGVRD